jgi:flagellar motor switch protein FliN/FliY
VGEGVDQDVAQMEEAMAQEAAEKARAATAEETQAQAQPEKAAPVPRAQTNGAPAADLDLILDLPLEVSVELGRASMLVGDLLQLGQGSVVELDKLAGEPLEILVNKKLVARGEAVVVNDKFGVRITDIVSASERVRKLA